MKLRIQLTHRVTYSLEAARSRTIYTNTSTKKSQNSNTYSWETTPTPPSNTVNTNKRPRDTTCLEETRLVDTLLTAQEQRTSKLQYATRSQRHPLPEWSQSKCSCSSDDEELDRYSRQSPSNCPYLWGWWNPMAPTIRRFEADLLGLIDGHSTGHNSCMHQALHLTRSYRRSTTGYELPIHFWWIKLSPRISCVEKKPRPLGPYKSSSGDLALLTTSMTSYRWCGPTTMSQNGGKTTLWPFSPRNQASMILLKSGQYRYLRLFRNSGLGWWLYGRSTTFSTLINMNFAPNMAPTQPSYMSSIGLKQQTPRIRYSSPFGIFVEHLTSYRNGFRD